MKRIVVIGAGILGAAAAYELSKLGAAVTIVDRQEAGQATGAAAGIICPWLSQRRNKAWYHLAKEGAKYYPTLIDELKEIGLCDTGYEQVGALCLQQDMQKLISMKERAEKRREDAPEIGDIQLLSEAEAIEKFPLISEGYHALFVSGGARVDGRKIRDALLRGAEHYGAKLIVGEATIERVNESITGVRVDRQLLACDEVIVCAGAWSNELLHPLGIDVHVYYQKAQIMHFTAAAHVNTEQWPVIMPPTTQYILAFPDQKVVAGTTHEDNVIGYDCTPTAGGIYEILNKSLPIASGLAQCHLKEVRVGFRPYTVPFLPVLGRAQGWDNLIVANGLGSSGLTVGPYVGKQLAKIALDLPVELELANYALEKAVSK